MTDPRAERSRAAALAAARELLAEQGWAAVTHVAVAGRSGVGRTTLYRHWPDSSALLRDAITLEISTFHRPPTGVLRDDLIRELDGIREMFSDPMTDRGLRAIFERAAVDPEFARLRDALFLQGSSVIRAILDAARARGELPSDLDEDLAVAQLGGPVLFRQLASDRPLTADQVTRLVDGFLAAYT
ncbi:TetR-like C-terminal domain-containing protein [Actinomadura rudentiformis]|uniref:TetR-like C-terminal domain-containing protein n=1 Tax=Actinomadura rudentiformis TaxID=359158 RepID=UPI001CEF9AE6|nr:TetR/AcrR family transcriptional regulator C-terminal ligand-binding domain-containing protein [Actinomadura rudentiformis]